MLGREQTPVMRHTRPIAKPTETIVGIQIHVCVHVQNEIIRLGSY